MTINIALEQEQQQRVQGDLAVVQNRKQEKQLNTDLYSEGYFEGYTGGKPSQPGDDSYWSGYQIGCREYWAKRLGVEIPTEF